MAEVAWHIHPTGEKMAEAVAAEAAATITQAVTACGEALIALPGGRSPLPVFERLASAPVPWRETAIIPTDDRLVPVESPLSNFAMLKCIFVPLGARMVPMAAADGDYRAAGRAAATRLLDLHWPPDLVWLGMGADGHTASIFPGPDFNDALESGARAVGVMPDPLPKEAPVPRVTLSLSAISSATAILLTVTGVAKRDALERALGEGALSTMPVGRVLAAVQGPVTIHWSP